MAATNAATVLHELGRDHEAMQVLRTNLERGRADYPADFWIIEHLESKLDGLDHPHADADADAVSQR